MLFEDHNIYKLCALQIYRIVFIIHDFVYAPSQHVISNIFWGFLG